MKEKKVTVKKETKKVVKTASISSEEMKDKTLQELKKAADKSFKTKCVNKKKIIGATLGALGLAAIGTVTPIVVLNANKEISISVQSVNATADKYKVKVKQGTKIKDIKIIELEGYDFVGYFKDEACTKPYKLTDELKKNTTIYASYKSKAAIVEYTVIVNGQEIKVSSFADVTIGEAIKQIDTLEYETSGSVYLNEACTVEADLNTTMTANTTLYTKAATLDKLSFIWNENSSSWGVSGVNSSIAGEVVIPACYTDGLNYGKVTQIIGDISWNMTEITIGDNITELSDFQLSHIGSLTKIIIGNGITSISDSAFYDCHNLSEIIVGLNNKKYHSSGNCLIETASKTLIAGCKGSIIPTDGSVTAIGYAAFYFRGFAASTINIPDSVTTINSAAFAFCYSLKEITIPNSVTTIGDYVIEGCSNLKTVIIESKTIANSINDNYWSYGNLLHYATTIYIKSGLSTSNSTYLTSNYTKQATSDKDGYDKWIKKQ